MLNENVIRVLQENLWDLATCKDGQPNVVPVAFKDITSDGKLLVGDVFLKNTLENLEHNDRIAISVYDAQKMEGYQIQGRAKHVTEGKSVSDFKAEVEELFNGAATAKGALVIIPEKVIITTPGPDNNQEI